MSSVTQVIKNLKQPYGGYIPAKSLEEIELKDEVKLNPEENISPILIGLTVDYLYRYHITGDKNNAFKVSYFGASIIGEGNKATRLLKRITDIDSDDTIISACKLTGYDVIARNGIMGFKPIEEINPDKDTIENIRNMVKRTIRFYEKNGPVILEGFNFEGGYTDEITQGDGDYLTHDTLWDLKVSKVGVNKDQTLQLLIYYIMGLRSIHKSKFENINKLGIFNPRLNKVFYIKLENIDKKIIEYVKSDIIKYNKEMNNIKSIIHIPQKSNEITVTEIVQDTNFSRYKIYKYIESGRLKAIKRGNKYFIKKEDFEIFKENLKFEGTLRNFITFIMLGFLIIFLVFFILKTL